MKKLLIIFSFLCITTPLWSHSIKFIAMDKYYDKEVPIDSILVHDMNTGEEKLYLTDSIFFETISSIEGVETNTKMTIYPNPVDDILNVDLNSSDITISDISGRVHFKSSSVFSRNISLNVAGLAQGIYAIRSGIQSQTFLKNTPSNGQEINILSSSYNPSSLVKENEVQSQFDYRFTIYSDGFKPKNYYTKALTKDTVVELDMSTVTSAFDGKHIRVEFSINCIRRVYSGGRNDLDYSSSGFETYKFNYMDTLVYRNGLFDLHKGTWPDNPRYDDHDVQSLIFRIDTVNKKIFNFEYLRSYISNYYNGSDSFGYHSENVLISILDTITYFSESNNRFTVLFGTETTHVKYEKKYERNEDYNYERRDGEVLEEFISKDSYIKIEFIDL